VHEATAPYDIDARRRRDAKSLDNRVVCLLVTVPFTGMSQCYWIGAQVPEMNRLEIFWEKTIRPAV
jgi:hypothetical protein